MNHKRHSYKEGLAGRWITSRGGIGGATLTAHIRCATCNRDGSLNCRVLFPPEQIDKKFVQAGWSLDPHTCPTCISNIKETKKMATVTSPASIKAQANVFKLLQQHFNETEGAYASGWSDQKIAETVKLTVEFVSEIRRAAFGEIKEPDEIRQLRDDINAAEKLAQDSFGAIQQEIASLRSTLAKVSQRWAA